MKSNLKENLIRFSRTPFTAAGRTNKDTSFKWMGMPGTHSFPLAFCLLLRLPSSVSKKPLKGGMGPSSRKQEWKHNGWNLVLDMKFHIEPSKWNPLLIGTCQKTRIFNLFIRWQGHHKGTGKIVVLPEFWKIQRVSRWAAESTEVLSRGWTKKSTLTFLSLEAIILDLSASKC